MLSLQENYFYHDILLSLHCVNIINEINNLYIRYVIIFCFSFGHGSWIYNYLCNQYLSPLPLRVRIPTRRGILDTTKLVSNLRQVNGFLGGFRFPPPIKLIFYHGITEILLKVALHTITLTPLLVIVLCALF